jgi:Fur family ferric uptake transcriptional regulator
MRTAEMVDTTQSFERVLRERGLRITAGRRAILEELARNETHFDAEGLLSRLRRHDAKVSRATVYRTLGQLVESGLLRKYDLGGRLTLYERIAGKDHHEHMICLVCGRMIEFVQDEIERLQNRVCRRHRFRPVSHTLQIYGVCEDCEGKG